MTGNGITRPFELDPAAIEAHMDQLVQATFDDLTSQFMLLPKGPSFLGYADFQGGYEALRRATEGFSVIDTDRCWRAATVNGIAVIVLRTIMGVTPPEWQDLAKARHPEISFPNGFARSLDRKLRTNPACLAPPGGLAQKMTDRVTALLAAACKAISEGATAASADMMHRLDKFDTREGLADLRYASEQHVPYAVLLYERYLGRPFASHRDAVSELVGDVMETAVEDQLSAARVPFRKTKRAERVPGFDQAPDFFIPDELAPRVIIEAKITGDDGTARDKIARIKVLAQMRDDKSRVGEPGFELVACVDGRGFGVRREDMAQLIRATQGKVFTANTLNQLVHHTGLKSFAIPAPSIDRSPGPAQGGRAARA
ncbi:MAG: hypothetical protein LBG60_11445 [Bifidobacteriaceae bacterium]|nr:hypothetical protein [Bifidobacteriaceae bacterium]